MVGYIERVMWILQKFYEVKFLRRSTKVLNAFVYHIKNEVKLVQGVMCLSINRNLQVPVHRDICQVRFNFDFSIVDFAIN